MSNQVRILVDELPMDICEDAIYEINQPNPNTYTHGFFKYPCKFIPEIPKWAIRKYCSKDGTGKVLDPFAGSGTTLLEASLAGISSIGAEIDEIAKLIIKVKSTKLNEEEISILHGWVGNITEKMESHDYTDEDKILPLINNLKHWFRDDILDDLGYLYKSLMELENENIRDFLLICMASIIKKVSNADDISPKPYVSNNVIKNPPAVSVAFADIVNKYVVGLKELSECDLAEIVVDGDATHIAAEDNSISVAITSPPYINAFDYVRTLRLENLWLQMATEDELREKKKLYLGTESIKVKVECENLQILNESALLKEYYERIVEVDEKRALILKKFFEDMKTNLEEVYRVLEQDGCYVIVIGNSSIRKVDVESWRILKDLAINVGFKYSSHFGYEIKNPYIRVPRGNKGGKIAIDHILVIQK